MYIWSNGLLDTLPDAFRDNISSKSIKIKFKLILKDLVADFLRIFKRTRIPKNKIWFLALTQNNYNALKAVKNDVPNSIFVSYFRYRSTINKETYYFSLSLRFFYDLFYPFMLLFYSAKNREKASQYYDLLLTVNGSYEECLRLIKKSKPEAIVFANDHLVIARALLLAANRLGVKTYYVQHASVSEYFPPLDFAYALLEGKDAVDKYKKCGEIKSEVHLVGMSKFDDFVNQINTNKKIKTLGVAFNFIDEVKAVREFLQSIKNEFSDLDIILRPHPGDKRDLSIFRDVIISKSSSESAFTFLTKIDCLISGDSSIHLEAALLNVYPLYYNFNESKIFDYYSFVKNGLVDYCSNINEVNSKLKELQLTKPDTNDRAVYYNSAIGTDYYGKSTQKISRIIIESVKATRAE